METGQHAGLFLENKSMNNPQPLDALMNKLGLTNADLVKASTEQLSFKMVNKGRAGNRRLSPNVQDKILAALLTLKPELKLRRRDLFFYDLNDPVVERIKHALEQIGKKEINYPQFVGLLGEAGITGYKAEVASNRIVFYGTGGEAHIEQGPPVSQDVPGGYDENSLRAAIADAQKELIDHPTFLKRIHSAGVVTYEVNIRKHRIDYTRANGHSYREKIALSGSAAEPEAPKPSAPKPGRQATVSEKLKKAGKVRSFKKSGKPGKLVKKHRLKKYKKIYKR